MSQARPEIRCLDCKRQIPTDYNDHTCPFCGTPLPIVVNPKGANAFPHKMNLQIQGFENRRLFASGLRTDRSPFAGTMQNAFQTDEERRMAEKQLIQLLVREGGKNASSFSGCLLIGGFVLLLVPVIGWILGPLFILFGIFSMLFPSLAFKVLEGKNYQEQVSQVRLMIPNCFLNVICPHCGSPWTKENEAFCFSGDPEGLDCNLCGKRVIRKGDKLEPVSD